MKYRSLLFSPALALAAALALSSCSINRLATRAAANALSGAGSGDVFTGDSDPELVGGALPVAIKVYEALLAQEPEHQGLILATGSLFVMYANAFVQGPADLLPAEALEERDFQHRRAKKLYLRGTEILLRGLELYQKGFRDAYDKGSSSPEALEALQTLLRKARKEEAPLLYWTAAGVLAAYSLDNFDFELGLRIPELGAMVSRAYELDPNYNVDAIDEFLILYYGSLPEGLGGDKALAEKHFQTALDKTGGLSAGACVAYAQSVCVAAQDYGAFKELLEKALAIDVDAAPSLRLVNILSQRKARHLLDTAGDLFLVIPDEPDR